MDGTIELPDGVVLRGRGLRNPMPAGAPAYGLYLGGPSSQRRYDAALAWEHAWIDWPDFLLPRDRELATSLIKDLHERARRGQAVEVACSGGVGRTGTVISCLAVLAGLDAAAAIAWTRANHHRRAVETPWQRRWVARFC
ncbi:protein-tyrosine phosphatase family protein [Nocardioides speluncae]|uniref:protein-tyrosine phosphatase family protein n=1 Tax=Nocardioides speluncae TaxID=2670337 RepID=UPI001F0C0E91|nr:protein-tyrosine phosphatase family protein [Nocardioides speluncae]